MRIFEFSNASRIFQFWTTLCKKETKGEEKSTKQLRNVDEFYFLFSNCDFNKRSIHIEQKKFKQIITLDIIFYILNLQFLKQHFAKRKKESIEKKWRSYCKGIRRNKWATNNPASLHEDPIESSNP